MFLGFFIVFDAVCIADTFINRQSKEVLHGYAAGRAEDGKTTVFTQQKGVVKLNPAEWDVTFDRQGRNNKVIVITLDGSIVLEIETAALEQAIVNASSKGALFILLEIDTDGGRVDLARRICAAIGRVDNCQIVAFIKGGRYGGAISAGAAVALACDKIYMAKNTVIGGAAVITISQDGPKDVKKAFGEEVGEKFSSIWRAYLGSLAEQKNRPALIARAMVDKDIEVVEVSDAGRRLFIEPVNRKPNQSILRTWSREDSLLTLTANEAVGCMIADKAVDSRTELLRDLDAAEAAIVIDSKVRKARERFERAQRRFDKLRKSIDFQYKQAENMKTVPRALKILRKIMQDYKTLIKLASQFPDLNLDVETLEGELNSVEAYYKQVKIDSKQK